MEEDDYSPMVLQNDAEYEAVKFGYPNISTEVQKGNNFPSECLDIKAEILDEVVQRRGRVIKKETTKLKYLIQDIDLISYPVQLPFSRSFSESCSLIRRFIVNFFSFAEGFQQQSNEIDDMLRKSLENILVQSLNGTLLKILSKCTISIAIQIFHNGPYWIKACESFEDLLMERRYSVINSHIIDLPCLIELFC